ncbi:hypothetical protein K488DRAFT_57629 [Vararia minispora EC-137]|uniref:Uncharacterized protein n=1 Tax=Vararia minispora EC-137 TaxID=1314806 RepID=A0ACB8QB80_9AGAM|nr:hypothetical protein K488DRAFT_57629 [Vararia minispora EC-137]
MSGIGSWLWGTNQLDESVDKATSELLPAGSEDIALNLEICDQIRSKAVPPKDAMRSLKRRLNHKNPNVQLLALSLTDICVKNGGDHFLTEVASREFIDNLVSLLKSPTINRDVRAKILRYIQNWAVAFGSKPHLSYAGQAYRDLKREGFDFPPEDFSAASSAMVDTQTAPEWIDSDVCLYCRDPFTFTNRKHHCRNCGRVFDHKCSSKTLPLPHFGITQEVRVCESCHKELTKHKNDRLPSDRRPHKHSSRRQRHATADEEADLQRAIRLSLEQAYGNSHYVPSSSPAYGASEPPLVAPISHAADDENDPDFKAAIEASLREANAPRPSAPVDVGSYDYATTGPVYGNGNGFVPASREATPRPPPENAYDLSAVESDTILTFSQTIEQLSAQGGRDLSRYPAVTQLLDKANGLRPKLAMNLDDAGRKEELLVGMNDKLAQAVKLYDRILTEQVARPRYGAPQPYYQQQAYQSAYTASQPSFVPPQAPYAPQQPAYAQQPYSPSHQAQYSPAPSQTPYSSSAPNQPQAQQVSSQPPVVPPQSQYAPPPPAQAQPTQPSAPVPPTPQPQFAPSVPAPAPAPTSSVPQPQQAHPAPYHPSYAPQPQPQPLAQLPSSIFPIVPSNPPTSFNLQERNVPNGFGEAKEASLIEL